MRGFILEELEAEQKRRGLSKLTDDDLQELISREHFDEEFELYEGEEQLSPFGNSLVIITEEQIEQLRQGKILIHNDGEYCTLIKLGGL